MSKKILVGLIALILVVLPLMGACTKPAPPAEEVTPTPPAEEEEEIVPEEEEIVTHPQKLKMGILFLLTGLWADQTGPESYGARDSALWMNEQGGIIFKDPKTGKKTRILIDVLQEETGGDIPTSISVYKKFRAAKCDFMVSMVSHEAEALAGMVAKDKQPFHESCSTPALQSTLPRYLWTYFPRYEDATAIALDFISKQDPGCKVGFVAIDITCGRSSIEPVIMDYARSIGLEPLPAEVVPVTVTDFTVELSRLKAQGAKWLFIITTSGQAAVLYKDMERIGWELDVDCKVFNAQCTQGDQVCKVAGYGGFYYASMVHQGDAENNPEGVGEAYEIIRSYWEKQGGESLCSWLLTYPLMFAELLPVYEGVRLAAEEYGWPLTPEQFVHGIYMLRDYNWHDLIPGGITMLPERDRGMCTHMGIHYYPVNYLETGKCRLLEIAESPRIGEVVIPEKYVWE